MNLGEPFQDRSFELFEGWTATAPKFWACALEMMMKERRNTENIRETRERALPAPRGDDEGFPFQQRTLLRGTLNNGE